MDTIHPHGLFQQALPFDEAKVCPHKTCTGPCGRTLPVTPEYFFRKKGTKDGFRPTCKDCDWLKRSKNGKARRRRKHLDIEVPFGQKLCRPCERVLPATAEFFYRDNSKKDGLKSTCKECESKHQRRIASSDIPDGMKRCSGQCKQLKPATSEFFQHSKQTKDGLYPYCKACLAEKRRTPESRAAKHAYNQAYYTDPDKYSRIRSGAKEKYRTDPEYRQKALDRNKLPEVREYNKAYLKVYNKTPIGKAKNKANKHRYRAREKSVAGTHTDKQIQELLRRQKHKCYYCQKEFEKKDGNYVYNIEHTFPISRVAGTDIPANDISYLVLACYPCNRDKGNKFPWEYPEGGRLF